MNDNRNFNNERKSFEERRNNNNNNNNNNAVSKRSEGYHSFFAPLFNLFDDLPDFHDGDYNVMRTDIKDEGNHYELELEVPGIDKKDLKIAVRNGYLVVSAAFNKKSDESKGKYIHFERETGSFSRSFYVGEGMQTKDIAAKVVNGLLLISVPKEVQHEDKDEFVQIQ